jgi:hypothetical protein
MKNFNAKEVKCNGIGGPGYQSAYQHKDAIRSIVEEVIDKIGRDKLMELAIELDPNDNYYSGRRFSSNEDLAIRLASGLGNYIFNEFQNEELTNLYIASLFSRLTYSEKQTLVADSARCCASADHWYEFEKEWD